MSAVIARQIRWTVGRRLRHAAIALGAICACFIHANLTLVVACAAVAWMLAGVRQTFQSLALLVLIKYLNPDLAQLPSAIGLVGWLGILVAAARVLPRFRARDFRMIAPLLGFGLFAVGSSLASSPYPDVSILKTVAFLLLASTVIVGCSRMSPADLQRTWAWILALYTAIVLVSLATYLSPGVAFYRGGGALKGALGHPQSLGIVLAPLAAWLLADIAMRRKAVHPVRIVIAIAVLALLMATQARTAAVVVLGSLAFGYLLLLPRSKRIRLARGRALAYAGLAVIILGIAFIAVDSVREQFSSFVLKRDAENIEEAFYSSRGVGIAGQWQSFLERPIGGNGFGVYPWQGYEMEVVYFMGLPLSAPVEKGFLPTMVLEEVGIVGASILVVLLLAIGKCVFRCVDPRWPVLFLACLLVNVGEAVFFSVNGIGLFFWCLMGLAIGFGVHEQPRR